MLTGDFSKTFSSATYQQIVAMKDTESGYIEGMAPLPIINIFFLHDGTTHLITLSFGSDKIGLDIREEAFDDLHIIWLEEFITEKLNQGI